MKTFIVLMCVIVLSSCQTMLKTAYGIKKPALENNASIRKYLLKNDIDTSNIYVFKDLISFAKASQKKMLNIPDAMFFNKDGNFVPYKKDAKICNADVDSFILDITKFSDIPSDSTRKMDELSDLILGKQIESDADVSVFITWTMYSGKLNRDKAFEWIRILNVVKSRGIKINYFLINCDYQESWNISKNALDKLGINH